MDHLMDNSEERISRCEDILRKVKTEEIFKVLETLALTVGTSIDSSESRVQSVIITLSILQELGLIKVQDKFFK